MRCHFSGKVRFHCNSLSKWHCLRERKSYSASCTVCVSQLSGYFWQFGKMHFAQACFINSKCLSMHLSSRDQQGHSALCGARVLVIKCVDYKFSKSARGLYLCHHDMQRVSVAGSQTCQSKLYIQMRCGYILFTCSYPWKKQLAAKDSQTINRQSRRWAEITLDNYDNKRIEENKDSGERVRRNGRGQKRQDGGTICLNINSLESKSPSLLHCALCYINTLRSLPPFVLRDGGDINKY